MEIGDVLLSVEESVHELLVSLGESVIDDLTRYFIILREVAVEFECIVFYGSIAVSTNIFNNSGNSLGDLLIGLARTLSELLKEELFVCTVCEYLFHIILSCLQICLYLLDK